MGFRVCLYLLLRLTRYTIQMRIVGNQNRSEIELDPVTAYRRGRRLDAMLRATSLPIPHGVTRGSHDYFQRMDEARMIETARRLNGLKMRNLDK